MANVFISHTGADIVWARQIHKWLSEDRHDVFLDVDQHDGVPVGVDWERLLFERLHEADAMVCILSPAYLESVWCAAEIGAARALGTELLPVQVNAEPLDEKLLRLQQYVDAAADPAEARSRLRLRLSAIDGAGGWGWPDGKSPYPGLRPFELGEHRVFFGRSRETTQVAERLRSPERAAAAILAVVGASGCGKSSLVRAGVLPRIAGESYWLALPPMLPGTDPLGNLVRAMAATIREHRIGFDVASLRKELDHHGLKAVSTDLLLAAGADDQCKLLIVIDQLEELLTHAEPAERAAFTAALAPALGGPVQVLATLRPEFLDAFASDADLSSIALRYNEIRPLDADALHEVIEHPAKVAGLSFEQGLATRLVTDTGTGDALPLLAFTLEQLAAGLTRGDTITEQRYTDLGGVRGALQRQADAALADACDNTGLTRQQVLSTLLGLVSMDENGRPAKRRVALDQMSPEVSAGLQPFVERRLLATQAEAEQNVIGVAHDAFLVNWSPLKSEIETQATALRTRRVVENAASDWVASGRDQRALLAGGQLAKAKVDTGAEMKHTTEIKAPPAGRKQRTRAPKWWPGRRQLVTRVDLNRDGRAFLEASIRADQSRRRRLTTQVVAVIAILAIATATSVALYFRANTERDNAQASAKKAMASRLQNEAADILSETKPGADFQAIYKILAAHALDLDAHVLAHDADDGPMRDVIEREMATDKIVNAQSGIDSVAFSPDGKRIATGGDDGMVRIWDAATGQPVGAPLSGHSSGVRGLAFSPDGKRLAGGSADHTALMWDTASGKPVGGLLTGHTDGVSAVAFSPDGRRLATASLDNTVRFWDADTGKPMGTSLTGHTEGIEGIAFSPDGHRMATAANDKTVRMWSADTGQAIGAPLTGHTGYVNAVAFSPDGRRLATGGSDKTVRLWNADTGQPIGAPLTGHTEQVTSVAFSPDGRRLASGSYDKTVRMWSAETGQPVGPPMTGHTNEVFSVAFSPDGHRLASGDSDGELRLWRTDAAQRLTGLAEIALDSAFSPDGHRLATAGFDKTVQLWDAATGEPLGLPLTGHTGSVTSVAFSPDGRRLASASADKTVRLWNADTGQPFGVPLIGHTDNVSGVAFSPDGHRVASASYDKTVRLWDADTGQPIGQPLSGHSAQVMSVAFSPDGRRLASASGDKTIRLWDAETGEPIGPPLTGHADTIQTVAFSPDGHRLASAGDDRTVRLWDADTGQPIGAPLTGHTGSIQAVAFSPDGHRLASAAWDKTVRLWDADTGQPAGAPITGHTDTVGSVAFSPDGRRLATTSLDRTVRFWPADVTPETLCDKLTTNMSRDQWHSWVTPDSDPVKLCPNLPDPGS
ncbi:WD40 repeat-containing protein (plasmid) [Mycobacterium sp. JS623]|uniref:nSTAND1 domain-containing NTPase n=1 Tax=Mycobacterium sp. JS623 TaxID=212767 RepID=UPI0002A59AC1|nr:TIR domain-containing protein [Mycobacterium sp. JS623]AGB26727.1 WD40 repeat-containing protein [Mycobacterium sp. JS623]